MTFELAEQDFMRSTKEHYVTLRNILVMELDLAVTSYELATTCADREGFERNLANARKACDSAKRVMLRLERDMGVAPEINERVVNVETLLSNLEPLH